MTPEALAALHAACFTTPRPWSADEFRDLLAGQGCFLVSQGQGFALGRELAGEAELLTIAVHPDARRAGLGREILRAFETEAHAAGAIDAFLEVAADNLPAIALYQSRGYAQVGCRKGYYHPPQGPAIDALILRKALIHP
ncbi:GNAT family N-acetyltransferase [Actibacterium sp. XHP0104]|uniref:GNAT family N-acetyltransferase n=1 Tax=Actibacterium sp. XHP0104 TaxID=2984335 RepID=UPI0021E87339|nr:GNAT family N-acetyltransferase [Actibacterium sp. XHP0104]MCV2882662.1 GNAT family N-acetyltransferase [Actibacterium sp. XHP0104]